MVPAPKILAAAAASVLLGVALGGCITVFPARDTVTTDPRASSLPFANVEAYARKEEAAPGATLGCTGASESRLFYVPQYSEKVTAFVTASLKPPPAPADQAVNQHFDFTLKDGEGVVWIEIHLKGNDTNKQLTIEGPRPGGWNVELAWNLCKAPAPLNIDDSFSVAVVVRQPA